MPRRARGTVMCDLEGYRIIDGGISNYVVGRSSTFGLDMSGSDLV